MHAVTGKLQLKTAHPKLTTAEYIVARLVDLGIQHAFTIPGDFSFPFDHALVNNPNLTTIMNANELNASYAADGYARVRGAAILCTTYGVGELSALNGVMGAKAEKNIIFHLVGGPSSVAMQKRQLLHHSLGDGEFGQFIPLSAAAAGVSAVITPTNAISEMNRVIAAAFKYREPAYIFLALDDAKKYVDAIGVEACEYSPSSNPVNLERACTYLTQRITSAKSIVAFTSFKLARFGLDALALELIKQLQIPFTLLAQDKTLFSENEANCLGIYAGQLSSPTILQALDNADLVLDLGEVIFSDLNTALFSHNVDTTKMLTLAPWQLRAPELLLDDIYLGDVLDRLKQTTLPTFNFSPQAQLTLSQTKATELGAPTSDNPAAISLDLLYHDLVAILGDRKYNLIAETGTCSINMALVKLGPHAKFFSQALWGSIGWATPATLGIAIAQPQTPTILVTGEGAHQQTLNELAVFARYAVRPIIICINNQGYTIERALEIDPDAKFDDIAQLTYTELPRAFGCDWLCVRVTTHQEFSQALSQALNEQRGAYIEVIANKYDYGMAVNFIHEQIKRLAQ